MLKKIPVSDIRMGMYIHELCGSWMDHSFWRSRFLVKKQSQLDRLAKSDLQWVWIDTRRGADVVQQGDDAITPADPAGTARAGKRADDKKEAAAEPTAEQEAFEHARGLGQMACEQVTQMFADARAGHKVDLSLVERMAQDMMDSVDEHPHALTSIARIKRADQYTYMHSVGVAALMTSMARTLGLDDEQVRVAGMAGLLHDIGKLGIPQQLLNKPGRLTDEEFGLMRTHARKGHAFLQEDPDVPAEVLDVCLRHHERFDGQGYPDGLSGSELGLLVRMSSVCDVYDDITSNKPYRKGWDPAFAIHKMMQWEGQFDPAMLEALINTLGRYPVGSILSLTDSELGLVIAQNSGRPEEPVVKVFYSIRWSHAIPERIVNLADPDCGSRLLPVAAPVDWARSGLPVPQISP